jgi:hypothetical protein
MLKMVPGALVALQSVAAQVTYQVFTPTTAGAAAPVATLHAGQRDTVRITLNIEDSTLKFVINAIAHQASLQTVYKGNAMLNKRIRVHLTNVTIDEAFARVLQGTGLVAQMMTDGETVVIRPASSDQHADPAGTGTVTGTLEGFDDRTCVAWGHREGSRDEIVGDHERARGVHSAQCAGRRSGGYHSPLWLPACVANRHGDSRCVNSDAGRHGIGSKRALWRRHDGDGDATEAGGWQ